MHCELLQISLEGRTDQKASASAPTNYRLIQALLSNRWFLSNTSPGSPFSIQVTFEVDGITMVGLPTFALSA